jgi:hypothetical protein
MKTCHLILSKDNKISFHYNIQISGNTLANKLGCGENDFMFIIDGSSISYKRMIDGGAAVSTYSVPSPIYETLRDIIDNKNKALFHMRSETEVIRKFCLCAVENGFEILSEIL